ncbi:DUF2628 domain-containing protein [Teichococcus vastitatis]|uniref:DUF2628 domain-containing protein n=1 Tax=Teichococcus vastitatis TaxID=2307076 RepID=A0ABS9WBF1_9PROT|nr:DUF2628 domain-containing protein [Pseudoroseomonas vastitatis]MCI0756631.1 DUF2628 domain-containing protein [Pseudoroseomonas vastitatis]
MSRAWTVHPPASLPASSVPAAGTPARRPAAAPARDAGLLLIPERFSLLAALLPPLWFLLHRLWWPLLAYLVFSLALAMLAPRGSALPLGLAAQLLVGLHAQDLRRWQLARRGRPAAAVVLARDEAAAMLRALDARPDWAALEAKGPRA